MIEFVYETLYHVHAVLGVWVQTINEDRLFLEKPVEEYHGLDLVYLIDDYKRAVDQDHAWLPNVIVAGENVLR